MGGWVPGIAPSRYPPSYPPRVHPHCPAPHRTVTVRSEVRVKEVVGLKSVAQLTLGTHISDIRGITEGYNVATADNPNDHKYIPGNK